MRALIKAFPRSLPLWHKFSESLEQINPGWSHNTPTPPAGHKRSSPLAPTFCITHPRTSFDGRDTRTSQKRPRPPKPPPARPGWQIAETKAGVTNCAAPLAPELMTAVRVRMCGRFFRGTGFRLLIDCVSMGRGDEAREEKWGCRPARHRESRSWVVITRSFWGVDEKSALQRKSRRHV